MKRTQPGLPHASIEAPEVLKNNDRRQQNAAVDQRVPGKLRGPWTDELLMVTVQMPQPQDGIHGRGSQQCRHAVEGHEVAGEVVRDELRTVQKTVGHHVPDDPHTGGTKHKHLARGQHRHVCRIQAMVQDFAKLGALSGASGVHAVQDIQGVDQQSQQGTSEETGGSLTRSGPIQADRGQPQ